jgi:hypothetical protein
MVLKQLLLLVHRLLYSFILVLRVIHIVVLAQDLKIHNVLSVKQAITSYLIILVMKKHALKALI